MAGFLTLEMLTAGAGCLPPRRMLSKPGERTPKIVQIDRKEDARYSNIKKSQFIYSINKKYGDNFRKPMRAWYLFMGRLALENEQNSPEDPNRLDLLEGIFNADVRTDSLEIRKYFDKYCIISEWETGITPGSFGDSMFARIERMPAPLWDYHGICENPPFGIGDLAWDWMRYKQGTMVALPEDKDVFRAINILKVSKPFEGKPISQITSIEIYYPDLGKLRYIKNEYTSIWEIAARERNDPEKNKLQEATGTQSFFPSTPLGLSPQEIFYENDALKIKLENAGTININDSDSLLKNVRIKSVVYPCPCSWDSTQEYNNIPWNCLGVFSDFYGNFRDVVRYPDSSKINSSPKIKDSINLGVNLKISDYEKIILNSYDTIIEAGENINPDAGFLWRIPHGIFLNLDSTSLKAVSLGLKITNEYTGRVAKKLTNYDLPNKKGAPNYQGYVTDRANNEAFPPAMVDGIIIDKDSISLCFPATGLSPDKDDPTNYIGSAQIYFKEKEKSEEKIASAKIIPESIKWGKIGDTTGITLPMPDSDSSKVREKDKRMPVGYFTKRIVSNGTNGYFTITVPIKELKEGIYDIMIDVTSEDSTGLERKVTTANIPNIFIR